MASATSGVDQLLDRALLAASEGDRATAKLLAGQVLAVDRNNTDAEDLLAAPAEYGEIRRLTILFADLVDSTALSTRIEPETYRIDEIMTFGLIVVFDEINFSDINQLAIAFSENFN